MMQLQEISSNALERDPSQQAIEFVGHWYTWGELRHIAGRVTELLAESGADPLAPVVIAPRNRPSAVACLMGLTAAGRNIRMIYVYQSSRGIIDDVLKSRPAAFIAAEEDFTEEVVTGLREAGIAAIALTDKDACAIEGCERTTAETDIGPESLEILVLTSGTTGKPKQFSFSYDLIADQMVRANPMFDPTVDPVTLTPMFLPFPLANISGIYATLGVLLHGLRGVLVDRFNLTDWREFVARYQPDWVGVPASAVQMILDADIPREELASIKVLSAGAAAVQLDAQIELERKYGVAMLTSYGATEFGGPVAMMTADLYAEWGKAKVGSVGRPFAGAQLRVVDPETGSILGAGQDGLLEVCTPRMGSHWIRTSDIGVIDEDGFVFHRGRADGAIVRGGFKLLPETIEGALSKHPAVAVASVVGVPDRRLGEVPAAAIQLRPNAEPPAIAALERHLRELVPATHIPARWTFVDPLPTTPSMKIDRAAVRALFAAAGEVTRN